MNVRPTIGLEIHAELSTETKMFCNSRNDPDEKRPNVNICPVCMGHPGTLPVINRDAVRHVLRVGAALGGTIADFTEFDRKNYFYPDLPKGYQISQYQYPLVSGGILAGVAITRVHLEEDTARSIHLPAQAGGSVRESLVDYNRAGVPLMELVTEPVVRSAEEAGKFARELQILLRYLGASEANMEKGEMRVEANISVGPDDSFGTKVEVKNLNSFRAVEGAIRYETERQTEVLARGEKVVQETRGWDEGKGVTFSQRLKEESHDYRYFPDPDLPKLRLSKVPEFSKDKLVASLPELPWAKRERYRGAFGLADHAVEFFAQDPEVASYFDRVVSALDGDAERGRTAANYLVTDVAGALAASGAPFSAFSNLNTAEQFAELIVLASDGTLSSRGVKDVLAVMVREGGSPKDILGHLSLTQIHDEGELSKVIDGVLAKNAAAVTEYRSGKKNALEYLVGQGMRATKGAANPEILRRMISSKISI